MGVDIVLRSNVPEALKAIDGAVAQRMCEAVKVVRNEAVLTLSRPGKGRVYENYIYEDEAGNMKFGRRRNIPHRASAPGDPPAVDTGRLRQSVRYEVEGNIGLVGTDLDYGKKLQFGTRKVAARPWLDVAFREAADRVIEIFRRPWL